MTTLNRDFDFDALNIMREKYHQERDKRIRSDGNKQYHEPKGQFSNYAKDPFIQTEIKRDALNDEVEVVVVGAGFGGLLAGASLREAGLEQKKAIRLIDQASDVGGTWYWNRFPGAMCDVESYIYMPLLEQLNYMPTEKYASGSEIFSYCQKIAEHYHLYDNACFQTEVTEVRWNQELQRWRVSTDRGDTIMARFVCMSNGILHRPKLPGVKGLENFEGYAFHTCRWDYQYTGGDMSGNMTGLENKRVAVVGTGATAIQCIPKLAESAEHVYVLQRTPSSIDVRNNCPTDTDWFTQQAAGWQQERRDNFNRILSGEHIDSDMINDGWTDISKNLSALLTNNTDIASAPDQIAKYAEAIDFNKMSQIRNRVDEVVSNSETADKLKAYYRAGCKRPCFHDEYLQSFNRDNVTLLDSQGKGVENVLANSVVVDGQEYPVDCLVFATGFELNPAIKKKAGYEVIGKNDLKLSDKWEQQTSSMHGVITSEFPNCFIISNLQSAFTVCITHSLEEQARHIAYIILNAKKQDATEVNVSKEAEQKWGELIVAQPNITEEFYNECTPGYYNREGEKNKLNLHNRSFANTVEYFKTLNDWREEGTLKGITFD